jgi:biopolymer transport protein ExbD
MRSATGMHWDISRSGREALETGLTEAAVHDRIYRGLLGPEDWVRRSGTSAWRQLGAADEFVQVLPPSGRKRAKGVAPGDEELDMTPMIDMTFLLLIFFMVTASFHMQKGFHFPPDKEKAKEENLDQPAPGLASFRDHITLWVHGDDSIHLDDGAGQPVTAAVAPGDLVAQLRQISQSGSGRKKLLVVPHETTSHEALVLVVDAAVQAGLVEVSLADIVAPPASGAPPPSAAPPRIIRPANPRSP